MKQIILCAFFLTSLPQGLHIFIQMESCQNEQQEYLDEGQNHEKKMCLRD